MDDGPVLAAGLLEFDACGVEGGNVHGMLQASEGFAAHGAAGEVVGVGVRAQGLAKGEQTEKFGVKVFHVPPPGGCANGRGCAGCGF